MEQNLAISLLIERPYGLLPNEQYFSVKENNFLYLFVAIDQKIIKNTPNGGQETDTINIVLTT